MAVFTVRPEKIHDFRISSSWIVDWFLSIHAVWFTEKTNMLFGKREIAREALQEYIDTGNWTTDVKPEIDYVRDKFVKEWMIYFDGHY